MLVLHSLHLIHTDIKLENIVLENSESVQLIVDAETQRAVNIPKYLDVRLIDFGSTVYRNGYHPAVVSTRHYRAPEVVLGLFSFVHFG